MARSITAIHKVILDDIAANENLSARLTSTSLYAIFRNFTYIIALAIYIMESLFDQHRAEVDTYIFDQKSGRLPWYKTMALKFQYGFDLVPDKDYFENGIATNTQIEASKIIKYAAVSESDTESRVIIKIAGEVNGLLTNFIDPDEIAAIIAYFKEVKWPGKITIINYKADKLYLNILIKRDALTLSADGMRLGNEGGNYPVKEAIAEFMKELDFDGELRLSALVDKLQKIAGVLDATILSAQSAWVNPETNGYGTPQPFSIAKIAESGYFTVISYDEQIVEELTQVSYVV